MKNKIEKSSKSNFHKILKVKRFIDKQVFEVGDLVTLPDRPSLGVMRIRNFYSRVYKNQQIVTVSISDKIDKSYNENKGFNLDVCEKVDPSSYILTTKDNVKIYAGSSYWQWNYNKVEEKEEYVKKIAGESVIDKDAILFANYKEMVQYRNLNFHKYINLLSINDLLVIKNSGLAKNSKVWNVLIEKANIKIKKNENIVKN